MTYHTYHFPGAYAYQPVPTLDELRARRLAALQAALAMYRRAHDCHPKNPQCKEWAEACEYWTQQAYHAHGEILARTDSSCFY